MCPTSLLPHCSAHRHHSILPSHPSPHPNVLPEREPSCVNVKDQRPNLPPYFPPLVQSPGILLGFCRSLPSTPHPTHTPKQTKNEQRTCRNGSHGRESERLTVEHDREDLASGQTLTDRATKAACRSLIYVVLFYFPSLVGVFVGRERGAQRSFIKMDRRRRSRTWARVCGAYVRRRTWAM